jgi:hypothetical protein
LEGEGKWLINEISSFNVPVKRRSSPKESSSTLRQALDNVLSLALSPNETSHLACSAYDIFVMFPRLILRPMPNDCQGRRAADALARRCSLLREGDVGTFLKEAHDAQSTRVANTLAEASAPKPSFSKTTRDAILSRAGAVGRACKLAFSYGMKSDQVVAAEFLAKLTLL